MGKRRKKYQGKERCGWDQMLGGWQGRGWGLRGFVVFAFCAFRDVGRGLLMRQKNTPSPRCSVVIAPPSSAAPIKLGRSRWRFPRAFSLRSATYNTPRPHPPPPSLLPTPRFLHNNNQKNSNKLDRPSLHDIQPPPPYTHTNPHVSPDLNERTNDPWRFCPILAHERKIISVGFWLFVFGIYASSLAFSFKLTRWGLVGISSPHGLYTISSPLFLPRGWSEFFFFFSIIIYIHR